MSGVTSGVAMAAAAVATVATVYNSYEQGKQQQKAAKKAQQQAQQNARIAQENAKTQAKAADEANNMAMGGRRANTGGALDAAIQAGRGGESGTMLTGPQGVDPNSLNLGRSTLLGS